MNGKVEYKMSDCSYNSKDEQAEFDRLVEKDDTIDFWVRNRIKGISASMALDGNVSIPLVKILDKKLLKYVKTKYNE